MNLKSKRLANSSKDCKQTRPKDRIEKLQENESYITIKGHKNDIPHKVLCGLINASKSEIGKISKVIIDKINTKLLEI